MSAGSSAGWLRMAAVALAVVAVDQVSKGALRAALEPGEHRDLVLGFELSYVTNSGIAFGLLSDGADGVVLAVTIAALALVVGWFATDPGRPNLWIGVGLLVGGAIGNLTDRLRHDAVTDFIDPPLWPSFNLADVAITLGVAVLVLSALAPAAERQAPT